MESNNMDEVIAKLSQNKCWVFALFVLTFSPSILTAMHLSSYVFLAEYPTVSCDIPELKHANWTMDQILNISVPNLNRLNKQNCFMYNWNYSYFGTIGYEKSIKFLNSTKKPELINCKNYSYNETMPTVISEWDIVCENNYLEPFIHASVASGKLVGAFIFGMIADRFGRRNAFIASCLIYLFAGPLAAFMPYFYLFLIMRFLIGIAGAGAYEAGYTILTELTVKKCRTSLGCIFNTSYSIGLIILPALAYISQNWQQLQLLISVPAVLFIFHCFYLPESPRWLVTQRRYSEASKIIKSDTKAIEIPCDSNYNDNKTEKLIWFKLISNSELRNRLLICHLAWFSASLAYFVMAFNSTNLSANPYIYMALSGLVEAPGYAVPLLILNYIGRKLTSVILFFIGGFALIIIIIVPSDTMVAVALFGRFCTSAVYAVVILYTSELFPTSHRNTAMGTSLTMTALSTLIAPFIVDFMGKTAWYLPSTVCGVLCVIAGSLMLLLPETWNRPLPDTVQEIKDSKRKVTIRNMCNYN